MQHLISLIKVFKNLKINKSQWEYLIERFSEFLNVHHPYFIFLLVKVFPLVKYNNKLTIALHLFMTVAAFLN